MSPTDQHIALMTSLGWVNVMRVNLTDGGTCLRGQLDGYEKRAPELSLDLMAMAEAGLSRSLRREYHTFLTLPPSSPHEAISANKGQRLEAYLKVSGLWRE